MHAQKRGGFSLTEVLIATIILALGLIGLGAIFPAVIVQQRNATDLSTAMMIGQNADSLLAERLRGIASAFAEVPQQQANDVGWIRINAYRDTSGQEDRVYLDAPYWEQAAIDLRIPEQVRNFVPEEIQNLPYLNQTFISPDLKLDHQPIDDDDPRGVVIRVKVSRDGQFTTYELLPNWDWRQGTPGRTNRQLGMFDHPRVPDVGETNNYINPDHGSLKFNFRLEQNERIEAIRIDYVWLDRRIISNEDRLYPHESPRYYWDMLIRKSPQGQMQYALFINRFDKTAGASGERRDEILFAPNIPTNPNQPREGMIQMGRGQVEFERRQNRFYLRARGDADDALDAGVSILPRFGSIPVRLRREVTPPGRSEVWWELEAPIIDEQSGEPITSGDVEFWYVPDSIEGYDDSEYRVTPLLVYTKPVDF